MTQQKLELTWLGKGEQPRLEPRLLLLEPEHCHGDPNAENILGGAFYLATLVHHLKCSDTCTH